MASNKKRLIEKIVSESKAPIAVKISFMKAYYAAYPRRKKKALR